MAITIYLRPIQAILILDLNFMTCYGMEWNGMKSSRTVQHGVKGR